MLLQTSEKKIVTGNTLYICRFILFIFQWDVLVIYVNLLIGFKFMGFYDHFFLVNNLKLDQQGVASTKQRQHVIVPP